MLSKAETVKYTSRDVDNAIISLQHCKDQLTLNANILQIFQLLNMATTLLRLTTTKFILLKNNQQYLSKLDI